MATEKTITIAEEILPHLVNLARQRKTATYGELAEWIERHPFNLRYPLAYLRDEITEPRNMPLLSALVVRGSDGLPSDSTLPGGRAGLDDEAYRARVEAVQQEAYGYRGWHALLNSMGLEAVEHTTEELDHLGDRFRNEESEPRTEAQQERREALQQFIVENPEAIYLWGGDEVSTAVAMPDGEQLDIVFDRGSLGYTLVAVRQGRRDELAAAIQKLDQWRDVFRKERNLPEDARIQARVVAYRVPEDLRSYAEEHDVKYSAIRPQRVKQARAAG